MAETTSTTATTASPVPVVYRVVFTWVDPIFCLVGLATHIFDPLTTLGGYSPNFASPPATETVHLLDSMAGFFATLGVLEAVLLRARPADVGVWRIVQASVALLDVFMVLAAFRALSADGRLDPTIWRGDDYRLTVGNVGIGLLRIACALGIGMGQGQKYKTY